MQHEVVALCFRTFSRLKINFHNSVFFCFGEAQGVQTQYTKLFGCKLGDLPLKYRGIPIHYRML